MPQVPFLLRHDHFFVRKSGARRGVPIDHAFAVINQSFLVKMHEYSGYVLRIFRIHGEALAAPIAGTAQLLELLNNDPTVLLLPFPNFLKELLAPKIVAVLNDPFFLKRPFHNCLRGNPGMVCSRQPEHFKAFHPRLARENVLDSVIQNVPKRQHAGDIRRRNNNRVRRLLRSRISDEKPVLQPEVVPLQLDCLGLVSFRNFWHIFNHGEHGGHRDRKQKRKALCPPCSPW